MWRASAVSRIGPPTAQRVTPASVAALTATSSRRRALGARETCSVVLLGGISGLTVLDTTEARFYDDLDGEDVIRAGGRSRPEYRTHGGTLTLGADA